MWRPLSWGGGGGPTWESRTARRVEPVRPSFNRVVRRLQALLELAHTDIVGIVLADKIHFGPCRYLVLHPQRPVARVHHKPAKALALEVGAMAHRRSEDAGRLALFAGVSLRPGHWHRLLICIRLVLQVHTLEHHPHNDRPAIAVQRREAIDIGRAPDVLAPPDDRIALHPLRYRPASAFFLVIAVVIDPRLAQDLPPPPTLRVIALKTVLGVWTVLIPRIIERMGSRPQPHNRLARIRVIADILHLLVRQLAKSSEYHHQISRLQRLQSGDIVLRPGIDLAALFIQREQRRALKPMMRRQYLR